MKKSVLDDEYAPRCEGIRCGMKQDCLLYTDRNNPNARVKANTLRKNWESLNIPCEVSQQYFGVPEDA